MKMEKVAFSIDGTFGCHTPYLFTPFGYYYPWYQAIHLRILFLNENGTLKNHYMIALVLVPSKEHECIDHFVTRLELLYRKSTKQSLNLKGALFSEDFEIVFMINFTFRLQGIHVGCNFHWAKLVLSKFDKKK